MAANTCMTLILSEKLTKACVGTGFSIQDRILSEKPPRKLDEMKELVKPLVEEIQKETEKAVRQELDEYQGEVADAREDAQREDQIAERRSDLSEMANVELDGHTYRVRTDIVDSIRRNWEQGHPAILSFEYQPTTSGLRGPMGRDARPGY